MSSPEHATGLVAAARQRHETARRKALSALRGLDASGAPVNMSTVARAAGVSRAWLYRQPDLRSAIEALRQTRPPPGHSSTPSAQRATVDSLHQQLDTLRARHAELQAENHRLREALARELGQRRSDPSPAISVAPSTMEPAANVEDMSTTTTSLVAPVVYNTRCR